MTIRTLRLALSSGLAVVAASLVVAAQPSSPESTLTVARLKALKSTSNDPAGDSFLGQPQELRALVDAFVRDTSLASPMQLFMASNTAFRQGRIEEAAFLFYAAQIRAAFDFERYDVSPRPDGNNAATYLAFLKETTGMSVNPAIMGEPARFAAVIARLERWEVVPAAEAYYPEFETAKGFKLPRGQWAARGREIKESFLEQFGRRMAKLLADPEYAAAFRFVQDVNAGKIEMTDATQRRMKASLATMDAAEARVFPDQNRPRRDVAPAPARDVEPDVPSTATPPAERPPATRDADDLPLRVGGDVPTPKKLKHVEPEFPDGRRGAVIVELTIDREGRVADVTILRGEPILIGPVERAVRQWTYEPVRVNGRPVSVLLTASVSAR